MQEEYQITLRMKLDSLEIFDQSILSEQDIEQLISDAIDSLPENLQKLATSAVDVGYLSKMDFDAATEADEVPTEEQDEVLDFFQQDLGLEILETDNFTQNMDKYYDDDSAVMGSNLEYAAIHQLGGQAGKNKSVEIPARPYLQLTPDDFEEILSMTENFLGE